MAAAEGVRVKEGRMDALKSTTMHSESQTYTDKTGRVGWRVGIRIHCIANPTPSAHPII